MVDAAAVPVPWLRVLSEIVIARPAPASEGAVNVSTCRSDPTTMLRFMALLVSTVSSTVPSPSARAMR